MSKMKHTLCYMAALVGFTACTQDELTGDTCKGQYPLTLTATVAGGADTRATVEGTWDGSEEIALKVDGDDDTYTYTVEDTNGNMSGDYYWKSTDDITVQGFYPYAMVENNNWTWTVEDDQSSDVAYQSGDVLCSEYKTVNYGETPSLTFYHQTAKVVVNIKKEGIMAENPEHEVAIQGTLSGTFTAPTGEDTFGTWTELSTSSSITPKAITPTEYAASYQALLIPQTVSDAFISITIDEKTFHYTPETETTLKPGQVYTYNITVLYYGLKVSVEQSPTWTDGNDGTGSVALP